MGRKRRVGPSVVLVIAGLIGAGGSIRAQGPTIDTPDLKSPGSGQSPFGRTPGAGGGGPSGGPDSLLGGRAGPTTPKGIPTSISTPGMTMSSLFAQQGVARTPDLPAAIIPASGPLSVPPTEEAPGPVDGLTLDIALDRVVRDNLDLRAKHFEIPQAKADVLTASLRANPVFYADGQLIPYGAYTRSRPGGQTQYDVNISYPLDLSGKRKARTVSATRAALVTEAQYQDAVRQTIDNLYSGYVDVLQARRTITFARASVEGLTEALDATEDLAGRGEKKLTDVKRIRIQLKLAEQQLLESNEAYRKAKFALGQLLNIPASQADAIEVRGTIKNPVNIALPALPDLIQLALQTRPDVVAYRLGLTRAKADVKLQYANRFQDVYVLYQPYTLQDNTPFGLKSPTSWALGVTVPLPIYNRNQGNIQRAKSNVAQTAVELSSVERQAILDVQVAEREYVTAKASVERIETDILPDSLALLNEAKRLRGGEMPTLEYLAVLKEYNDNARTYLDSLVRFRRATLNINTVVGQRILP